MFRQMIGRWLRSGYPLKVFFYSGMVRNDNRPHYLIPYKDAPAEVIQCDIGDGSGYSRDSIFSADSIMRFVEAGHLFIDKPDWHYVKHGHGSTT